MEDITKGFSPEWRAAIAILLMTLQRYTMLYKYTTDRIKKGKKKLGAYSTKPIIKTIKIKMKVTTSLVFCDIGLCAWMMPIDTCLCQIKETALLPSFPMPFCKSLQDLHFGKIRQGIHPS
jgi:hypothetical protein